MQKPKKIVVFDTETETFRPGCMAPPMACMPWVELDGSVIARSADTDPELVVDENGAHIVHGRDPRARAAFTRWIRDPETLIVGQHVAFDMAVCAAAWPELLPDIFLAYASDRVACTKLRMQLFDIATGQFKGFPDSRGVWRKHTYDLAFIAKRLLGQQLVKDGWRLRYGEFVDTPISGWEALAAQKIEEARALLATGVKDKDLEAIVSQPARQVLQYPLDDASSTLRVYLAQEALADQSAGDYDIFADQFRQARGAWWLTLTSNWGMLTDAVGVAELRRSTEEHIESLERGLVAAGLVRADGTRNTKAATARMLEVCEASGLKVRRTDGGGVSLDRDACKESGDPVLRDYGNLAQFKAVLAKDVPMLEAGVFAPIHTRYGLAETGRSTSAGPNLQNMRRLPGIREAFRPRRGYVFAQADYPQLELRTLAQACLDLVGESTLAKMLNEGLDPHLAFAASLLRIPYEEAKKRKKDKDVDNARQIGKVFNFGKPGGLGAAKLVLFARKTYGVELTEEEVRARSLTWLETFPEMRAYFDRVARMTENDEGLAHVMQLRSSRLRGGATYTAACNSYFQGLGADATKAAGFLVSHACYVDRDSPLFGSRPVLFVHDELILETPDDARAHDAAIELSRIMREAANEWVPEVPFRAPDPEPLLMRVWSKNAVAVHGADGRLVPWVPEPAARKAA